jgi:hypothetical protein
MDLNMKENSNKMRKMEKYNILKSKSIIIIFI